MGCILRDLHCRGWTDRVTEMGGYLFFRALVVVGTSDFLRFDRADSIPLEFDLHVGRLGVDAARGCDGSFMALLVVARKGIFLSLVKK